MTTSIYILRLEGGHYYVGKSDNVMLRYQQHLNGSGSGAAWTTRHPPVSLIKTIENASPFDEDKTVKEYMATYGIDKVRGGSYVTEVLTEAQRSVLQQEIWGSQGKCTRCGSTGHWIATCHVRLPSSSVSMPPVRIPPVVRMPAGRFQAFRGFGHRLGSSLSKVGRCFRCGRTGHYVDSCYASTDTRGYELDDEDEEDEEEEEEEEEDEDD
jgi:predicted GIY-YIG superfamily endonuclease